MTYNVFGGTLNLAQSIPRCSAVTVKLCFLVVPVCVCVLKCSLSVIDRQCTFETPASATDLHLRLVILETILITVACLCFKDHYSVCIRSSMRADSIHSSSPSASSSRSPSRSSPLRPPAAYKPTSSRPVTMSAHTVPSSRHQDVMSAGDWLQTATASGRPAYIPPSNEQDVESSNNLPLNVPSPSRPGDMSTYRRLAAGQTGTSATSQPDVMLAANTQTNMLSPRQYGGMLAQSRSPSMPTSSHHGAMSAGSRSPSVVPLQASYQKPRDVPRGTKMNAITTHVDDQCHIFVHQLHDGLYLAVSCSCFVSCRLTQMGMVPTLGKS